MLRRIGLSFRLLPVAGIAGFALPHAAAESTLQLRLVSATGLAAPQTSGNFASLTKTSFADDGSTAFQATLTLGGAVTPLNDSGAWSDRSGALLLEAREADVAPDTGGLLYRGAFTPRLNSSGDLALYASLQSTPGGSEVSRGIWTDLSGALVLRVQNSDPAPDIAGATIQFLPSAPAFSEAGSISFRAILATGGGVTTSSDTGIWTDTSGSIALLAREGDNAPSTPGVWGDFSTSEFDICDSGATEVLGSLATGVGGIDFFSDSFIASSRSGSLTVEARESDTAPGTSEYFAGPFQTSPTAGVGSPTASVFASPLKNVPGFGSTTGSGVWSDRSGSLSLLYRDGDASPGVTGTFKSFFEPRENGASEIAFRAIASVDDGMGGFVDRVGVWAERDGALHLIAIEGAAAPGTDSVFADLTGALATHFGFDDSGAVLLWGRLDTNVGTATTSDDYAIWLSDPGDELTLILREGDVVDLLNDGTDLRTVGEPTFGESETHRLNDLSEALLTVDFDDGSRALLVVSLEEVVSIPGDLTGDGVVDGADLASLLAAWGSSNPIADLDNDGIVSGADLAVLLANWT